MTNRSLFENVFKNESRLTFATSLLWVFEFAKNEVSVYRERGYGEGCDALQPQEDRCALACAMNTTKPAPRGAKK